MEMKFSNCILFFLIGNRNFIEIDEHCVDDNKHSEMKQNTYNSRTKACRL